MTTKVTRPQVFTRELIRIRITPSMERALAIAASKQRGGNSRSTRGVSHWVRAVIARQLDQELPGWDS